jgi:hypothetical protein
MAAAVIRMCDEQCSGRTGRWARGVVRYMAVQVKMVAGEMTL